MKKAEFAKAKKAADDVFEEQRKDVSAKCDKLAELKRRIEEEPDLDLDLTPSNGIRLSRTRK